jgi:nitrogenase molybdenum-iron protein alpha/beta subunit
VTDRDAPLADYRLRFNFPYLIGVYLAVNAVRDAYLLVDGPDCAFLKAQHVWGRHDQHSTLLSPDGDHRVLFTAADGRKPGKLSELRAQVRRLPGAEIVLFVPLSATAYPAEQAAAEPEAGPAGEQPWIPVPGRSLESDWLGGYGAVLEALARELPLERDEGDERAVGIVGYLFDRNEADHHASVAELERLIAGLGLRLVSTWLAGGGRAELAAIGRAQTIVSLPYGRAAARALCERTGARLVELDLPMGLEGTTGWLQALGAELGRKDDAAAVVKRELAATVPRLARAVGRFFLNKRFVLCQDPFVAHGLAGLLSELGGVVDGGIVPAMPSHVAELVAGDRLEQAGLVYQPREHELVAMVQAVDCDLSITNSELVRLLASPCIELGFPCVHHHALFDSPLVGFRGALLLAQRIVNELMRVQRA